MLVIGNIIIGVSALLFAICGAIFGSMTLLGIEYWMAFAHMKSKYNVEFELADKLKPSNKKIHQEIISNVVSIVSNFMVSLYFSEKQRRRKRDNENNIFNNIRTVLVDANNSVPTCEEDDDGDDVGDHNNKNVVESENNDGDTTNTIEITPTGNTRNSNNVINASQTDNGLADEFDHRSNQSSNINDNYKNYDDSNENNGTDASDVSSATIVFDDGRTIRN
jgi:hypothetical protein